MLTMGHELTIHLDGAWNAIPAHRAQQFAHRAAVWKLTRRTIDLDLHPDDPSRIEARAA
jgi:hypothetical protein